MDDEDFEVNTKTSKGVSEYEKVLKVKKIEDTPVKEVKKPVQKATAKKTKAKAVVKENKPQPKVSPKKTTKVSARTKVKKPDIEDSEGFDGRRPIVDPFTVGEKITWDVSYLNMSAGTLTLETKPFVEVNGAKSYHFSIGVNSSSMFGFIYKIKDTAETYVDYNSLRPHNLEVHVKESKQIKESRTYFNWDKLTGHYWMKRKKKGHKEQEKKKDWKIKDFSQNFVSASFYLRTFTWTVGKTVRFYMADEGKNLIFKAKAIRKETITTDAGTFKTIVIKPGVENIGGSLKPVGELYMWLTDDERKIPVRVKTAIKIGSVVAEATSIK